MTTLEEFGVDVDDPAPRGDPDVDRNGYGFRRDRCAALSAATGEQCGNPISRREPESGLCATHLDADDVELVEEVVEP